MALPFKPHTVTVQTFAQTKGADKRNDAMRWTDTATITGMISADTPEAIMARWGVDTKRPHKILFELEDASSIKVNDRIVWGSRTFTVVAPIKKSYHGLITDHAKALLEEIV